MFVLGYIVGVSSSIFAGATFIFFVKVYHRIKEK